MCMQVPATSSKRWTWFVKDCVRIGLRQEGDDGNHQSKQNQHKTTGPPISFVPVLRGVRGREKGRVPWSKNNGFFRIYCCGLVQPLRVGGVWV